MGDLLAALCLVMVIEGILPFVAPKAWREAMRQTAEISDSGLRLVGAGLMVVGLLCLMWVRG